jgi:hypothetical protein
LLLQEPTFPLWHPQRRNNIAAWFEPILQFFVVAAGTQFDIEFGNHLIATDGMLTPHSWCFVRQGITCGDIFLRAAYGKYDVGHDADFI